MCGVWVVCVHKLGTPPTPRSPPLRACDLASAAQNQDLFIKKPTVLNKFQKIAAGENYSHTVLY